MHTPCLSPRRLATDEQHDVPFRLVLDDYTGDVVLVPDASLATAPHPYFQVGALDRSLVIRITIVTMMMVEVRDR
jgi:hypothetical protein